MLTCKLYLRFHHYFVNRIMKRGFQKRDGHTFDCSWISESIGRLLHLGETFGTKNSGIHDGTSLRYLCVGKCSNCNVIQAGTYRCNAITVIIWSGRHGTAMKRTQNWWTPSSLPWSRTTHGRKIWRYIAWA
jgi:hypothetical protein